MKGIKLLSTALIILLSLVVLFPFFYALLGSFFSASDFASTPAKLWPTTFKVSNYLKVLTHRYFLTYIFNSLLTGVLGSFIRIIIGVLAAYAFAYLRFPFSRFIFAFIVATLFIPSDLLLIQNYITIQKLGLIDTYLGIISTSLLPAAQILMLRQFFLSVPSSLHDSAVMDGAGDYTFISKILLPLSKAVVSSLLLQSFVTIFNSYLWPLLVTNKPRMRTVQVGITMLGYAESLNYGPIFAAIVIVFVPFLIIFILMRKRIMKALTRGYMYA